MAQDEIISRLKPICDYDLLIAIMAVEKISVITHIELSQLNDFLNERKVPKVKDYLGRQCVRLSDLRAGIQ